MNRREFFIRGSLLTAAPVLRENGGASASTFPPVGSAGEGNTVYDLQPVVKGVYAAIPRPHYVNNSNSAVINLGDCLLVVDTGSQPSAASSLIKQIRARMAQPVKYIVNTHFHFDHYRGNQAYLDVWPDVEIISTEATRKDIERRGVSRLKNDIVKAVQDVQRLKAELSKQAGARHKEQTQEQLRRTEAVLTELRSIRVTLPTLTYKECLTVYGKSRIAEIVWLGRAHTDGDSFVYLPADKVLMTGDVLSPCELNVADGYPYSWIDVLDRAERLDFQRVIGGHGEVLRGKGQFDLFRRYLNDLMAETSEAYTQGLTPDEVKNRVAAKLLAQYSTKFSGGLPHDRIRPACPWTLADDVVANVEKAYRVISGAQD